VSADSPQPLSREIYRQPPAEVAPRLLGCLLCRRLGGELLAGRIVETEAYLPSGDLAAHQRRPRSAATASLFGEEGRAYVHRLRHHHLLDVVTRPAGVPLGTPGGAVLIRALEPLAGLATMAARRGTGEPRRLAAGPGRLCQALAIDLGFDGHDLTAPGELFIAGPDRPADFAVVACTRIGISGSAELALRFVAAGSAFLSAPPSRR
jgi:DNA-3-methyladenine glycosylase